MEAPTPRSKPVLLTFMALAGVTLLAGLVLMFRQAPKSAGEPARLLVYAAAGLRAPVEAAIRAYEKETGDKVDITFGGSQTILANAEVSKVGDLFIPADETYITLAEQKKLTAETVAIAVMHPRLAVKKGNPKSIRSVTDLLKEGVALSQANPDAAAVGKVVREELKQAGKWDAIAARTTVFKGTVNDALNDVVLGATDAAFGWDALASQYPGLDFIELPELTNASAIISAAVLATSKEPQAALRLARYLSATDKGLTHFKQSGFQTLPGDSWSAAPELNLFAGAMLRPAIEETIIAFEKREGVRINRIYNGCGILVAEMRTGKHPDVYFSCDTSFMSQVTDLFGQPSNISANQLVILVPKGNPQQVKTLGDLAKPGIRLGVGHEKQCALGALTRNTLLTNGTYLAVRKNVAVESPTGDFLVNQLRAKALDAVIAYVSNAAGSAAELDAISVDIPCAVAAQPIAVGRDTKTPQLSSRLVAAFRTTESRVRFERNGFNWLAK